MISSPTKLIIWSTLSTDTRIGEDSAAAFFGAALPGLLLAGDLLACAFSATGAAGFSSDAEGSAGVLGTGVAGSAASLLHSYRGDFNLFWLNNEAHYGFNIIGADAPF